jgi:hypothetical protein
MNYRGAWQQALSVLGRNTSRTAPVRNQSPALYRDSAGSCSKILPSAQTGRSGQMPAQTLSVMSVTGLQSGVGSPATTGPKRSVPFLRLARPKSPHQNRKAVRPTATLPHCLKRILTISLALNLILRPLSDDHPGGTYSPKQRRPAKPAVCPLGPGFASLLTDQTEEFRLARGRERDR